MTSEGIPIHIKQPMIHTNISEEKLLDSTSEVVLPEALQESSISGSSNNILQIIQFISDAFKFIISKVSSLRTIIPETAFLLDAIIDFFSTTSKINLILYLIICFTWSYLQKSSLILLILGCTFGYMLRNNDTSNQQKTLLVQETYIQQNTQNSLQAIKCEKATSSELSITPRVDDSLNKAFDFIIRDIVVYYYSQISSNKDSEFQIHVRNAMNVMATNLSLCLQNMDKVELGIMSSFAIANNFIVHLREYKKFIVTNESLSDYCLQNKASLLAHTTNRESQAQVLRSLSKLLLTRLLPSNEIQSHILMTFLSELWAIQIFEAILERICDSDWLNCTIVGYLTDIDPDETHDTTFFQQLATSIDEELTDKFKQPSDDYQPPISINQPLTLPTTLTSTNMSLDSNVETFDERKISSETHEEVPPVIKEVIDPIVSPSSFSPHNPPIHSTNLEEERKNSVENHTEVHPTMSPSSPSSPSPSLPSPSSSSPRRSYMRSVNSERLRFILERQADAFAEFMAFLEERKSANLLRFWLQADSFKKIAAHEQNIDLIHNDASGIFKTYFGETALYPVRVVNEMLVRQCAEEISNGPTCNCFRKLQGYVFVVLENEYFDDFIKAMKRRGGDMSFMYVEEPAQFENLSIMSIDDRFYKRNNTVDNSFLSFLNRSDSSSINEAESTGLVESPVDRPRSFPAGFFMDALDQITNSLGVNENSVDTTTEEENDSESLPDRPKTPLMNLNGVRIRMTDISETNRLISLTKSRTYMIEVEQPGSAGWIMTRSFNDFETLHSALGKVFPKAEKVTMPRLMWKKNHEACKSLERYLNILLSDATLCESEPLQKFMKRDGLPNDDLERPTSKINRALSMLSIPKSISMVNLVSASPQDAPKNQENQEFTSTKFSFEGSDSKESSDPFPPYTDRSQMSDDISVKNSPTSTFSLITCPSIESTASDESIILPNENDTPEKVPNLEKPRRPRPNKQMTGQDIDLLIDTIFDTIEEIFDLSEKSQWHLRKTVLSVLRGVVRRSYTLAIKEFFLTTIDSFSTEEYMVSLIDGFTNSFWPNGVWADSDQQRSEEDKLRTKDEAKRLLLQKAIPDSLKQVMGYENSKNMIGKLVDGFLAEKEVVRGMGINILENVVKLIIIN
ncbi:PXA domain-containing protein [Gigaspora margarita]|uniref:PXA domain-containing protein n=1 Tax=Gigaspora margarita TaxID=4874 RepID=A0A8H4AC67_GIGMA|nr:PXA domain-containing protein [Gigaspora margarita]